MTAFLAAYDLLASDRNDGVDASLALPASRTVSRLECLRLNPLIDPWCHGGAVGATTSCTAPNGGGQPAHHRGSQRRRGR